MSKISTFFPKQVTIKPSDTAAHTQILHKWGHRKAFLRFTTVSTQNLFHAWYHVSRFQILKRRAKIHAWSVRQLRFQEVIASATAAALKHDTHSLFQIINKFSPKQPMRRMQLRNQQGQIASPPEETAMLRHFIQETWKGPKSFETPDASIPALPFSQAELLHALSQMPATKAVARPCAPAIVWKSIAPQIAQTM